MTACKLRQKCANQLVELYKDRHKKYVVCIDGIIVADFKRLKKATRFTDRLIKSYDGLTGVDTEDNWFRED